MSDFQARTFEAVESMLVIEHKKNRSLSQKVADMYDDIMLESAG